MPVEANLTAGERWTFDAEVTDQFGEMLERSIPDYPGMRRRTFEVASRFVRAGTAVVDMGCSRGDAIKELLDRFGARCRFVGCEVSEPMLRAARERFQGYIACGVVDIRKLDLRTDFPEERASVVLSVLTLQFTPLEYRARIVRAVWERLRPGGAFLLVEKVIGADGPMDRLLVDLYHEEKRRNGYTQEEIDRKRLALEGVLVPVTAKWNEELLRDAGFRSVECYWRCLNFAGWLAVKDGEG
jgi:tRNA (cmo5U34)-methyltransferase